MRIIRPHLMAVTFKKVHVETFRTIRYLDHGYRQRAPVVRAVVRVGGLAPARPIIHVHELPTT